MIWFILAWRNFIRNTRKSYFTLLIILVGTLAAIIAIGYMKATFMLVKEGTIKGGLGHIQIAKKDTFDGFEEAALQHGISATEANKIEDILTQHSNVQLILPRIKFQGLISRGNTSLVFIGEGIEAKKERQLAQAFVDTVDGKGLEYANKDDIYNIVIGSELARLLDVSVGDDVTLMTVTTYGGINAVDVTVFGISNSGSPELDRLQVKAPLQLAQSLLLTDKISRFAIKLTSDENLAATKQSLEQQLPQLTVRTWQQLSPFYDQMISLYSRQFSVFGVIICLVIVLTVLNAMLMNLYDRKQELATMVSIGISQFSVKLSCVIEGIFIGIFASIVSIAVGYGLCELINQANIAMPPPPGRTQGYQLLVLFDFPAATLIMLISSLLCAFSAWLASSRISKMNLVEAINNA